MTRSRATPKQVVQRATTAVCAPLLAFAAMSAATTPAFAEPAPAPGSAELVPIQVTGAAEDRFSLVIMGDGYTADELPKYREQVEEHLNVLWSIEPYKSYRNYFNVYSIEIVSAESGVDCDRTLDAPKFDTALNMSFWGGCNPNSVERLLTVDGELAKQYAALAPKVDQIVAIGNSDTYGGAGGTYATASGGNALSALITPHEIGHSLGQLQDEYDYYSRGETTGDYTGPEPTSKHHTTLTEEQMREQQAKWWRWLGEESESGGKIGAFEGGMYSSTGVYRPSRHSQMKTLGYAYDQVSREIMTERISARTELVTGSSDPEIPAASDETLWVETAQPVYHDLAVSWAVNGEPIEASANTRSLDLGALGVAEGDEVTATVVDETEFVRDPALRDSASMTEVVKWTVGAALGTVDATAPAITLSSPTDRLTGGSEVLYVNTTHARDRAFDITWAVDGEPVPDTGHSLDLKTQGLDSGAHTVTATVTDPAAAGPAVTQSWTVDNGAPTVSAEVTGPAMTGPALASDTSGAEPHYSVEEEFSMELTPSDDQPGYVVVEFRLDGDGWHNYYGWPTDKNAPFKFTPTGINIDDLVYGNLGTGGMSLSPFQDRDPGYGDHRVEYRAIDAAGNIAAADAFTVTVYEEGTSPGAGAAANGTAEGTAGGAAEGAAEGAAGGAAEGTTGATNASAKGSASSAGSVDAAATADPSGGQATGPNDLAATGGSASIAAAGLASVLVAGGVFALVRRRRSAATPTR